MSFLSKLLQALTGGDDNTPVRSAPAPAPVVEEAPSAPQPQGMTAEALISRLQSVIGSSFPEVQVQVNVPAAAFDAAIHPMAKPISLLVSKGGKPILAIAVVRSNTYRSLPVVSTKKAIEARGIAYVRFFCEFENRPDYIADRLSDYLR